MVSGVCSADLNSRRGHNVSSQAPCEAGQREREDSVLEVHNYSYLKMLCIDL